MIEISLNGEQTMLPTELSLAQLCDRVGIPPTGIAIALNYELVPKSRYEETRVHNNDAVEIVTATAGG